MERCVKGYFMLIMTEKPPSLFKEKGKKLREKEGIGFCDTQNIYICYK